jgi:menaquinone-dependent protoporphyrinogen oxidase
MVHEVLSQDKAVDCIAMHDAGNKPPPPRHDMPRILIVYSTVDGHTLKICQRLQGVMVHSGYAVKLASVEDDPDSELASSDKIVIGASIRYGKHRPQVYAFVNRNHGILVGKPGAFFSVNVVARKPEKCSPETNPYMKKFTKQSLWKPQALAVFAGRIEYRKYSFRDRHIIRFIMWLTHGPTHPDTVAEFTDWNAVDAFARKVCAL